MPALHAGDESSILSGIIWRLSRMAMTAPSQGADEGFESLRRQYCGLAQMEEAAGSEPAGQRFESFIRSFQGYGVTAARESLTLYMAVRICLSLSQDIAKWRRHHATNVVFRVRIPVS